MVRKTYAILAMAFSFFFRDVHVLERASEYAVPALMGRSRARIWDAGCALGQEPYTLAMLLAEKLGPFALQNLRVCATDRDEDDLFGPAIAKGVYAQAELERIPAEIRHKYFEPVEESGYVRVIDRVRNRIQFQKHDLLSLQAIGEGFTLIVCKNVLLHFAPEERIQVVRMFHQALAPDGFLAMEQTQKLPEELSGLFNRVVSDGQLFQKAGD